MTASLRMVAGGVPGPAETAALAAALAALIDEERAAVPADSLPAVYRSRWRRAATLDGVGADDQGDPHQPSPAWLDTV